MYPIMTCGNCGSENHRIAECPPRERAVRTCEVNIGGVTTKYVSKVDHDAQVGAMNERINALTAQLAKVKCESDWRWYKDHIETIQRRYEAELDMYRKPPQSFVPVSALKVYTCPCGAKRSSRENLLSHIRIEASYRPNITLEFRELHIQAAAAFNTLYPKPNVSPPRITYCGETPSD